jgi:hypothetical protein
MAAPTARRARQPASPSDTADGTSIASKLHRRGGPDHPQPRLAHDEPAHHGVPHRGDRHGDELEHRTRRCAPKRPAHQGLEDEARERHLELVQRRGEHELRPRGLAHGVEPLDAVGRIGQLQRRAGERPHHARRVVVVVGSEVKPRGVGERMHRAQPVPVEPHDLRDRGHHRHADDHRVVTRGVCEGRARGDGRQEDGRDGAREPRQGPCEGPRGRWRRVRYDAGPRARPR